MRELAYVARRRIYDVQERERASYAWRYVSKHFEW